MHNSERTARGFPSYNSVTAARGFSASVADPMRFLPGLDLANEVRQLHERGERTKVVDLLRGVLGVSLADADEWAVVLTGWRPELPPTTPKPAVFVDVAGAFDSVADKLRVEYPQSLLSDALYRVANEIRRAK